MFAPYLVVFSIPYIANGMLEQDLVIDKAGSHAVHTATVATDVLNTQNEVAEVGSQGSCSKLKSVDGGAMYTVEVDVGKPEQKLDVVVDTGSNLLVVESCVCRDSGYCNPAGKCFREQNSSTLSLVQGSGGLPATAILNFGSGSILTEVATDRVRIGQLETRMKKGVLLMVDQLLDFFGAFEGLLGLGLPSSVDGPLALRIGGRDSPFVANRTADAALPPTVQMDSADAAGPARPPPWSGPALNGSSGSLDVAAAAGAESVAGEGFLAQAGVSRFSVCLGDDTDQNPGILRFDPPAMSRGLKSIGTMHWGLDFRGVSVGDSAATLGFCSVATMSPSQQTPCGAIPDSGTTYMMGPQDQLIALIEGICDAWPRCSTNYTAMVEAAEKAKSAVMDKYHMDPWNIKPMSKGLVFEMLMRDCDAWFDDKIGLEELPPIHFHLADDTGKTKAVTLDGWAYVISAKERERRIVYQDIPGEGSYPSGYEYTGRTVWICRAAMGVLEYPTERNGPAWILGMPIFHQHVVGFDVSKAPPTVSFAPGPCGECGGAALITPQAPASSHAGRARRPRRIHGRPRIPRINVSHAF
mmetsp:Transcript_116888/g.342289  ORF Transcript_116888/g.342289 Transcript_116888/m.342289 type:complete len:582 (-) Transcript_116888:328-2073(-)